MQRLVIASALTLSLAACGRGPSPSSPAALNLHGAWARAADSGMVTAAYFTLANPETARVVFTGASSPLAESVSLHMTHEMDGMVHMLPLDSAPIAPGDSLVLAEQGTHLMVSGLRRKLVVGDSLPITLTFAGGRELRASVAVRAPF